MLLFNATLGGRPPVCNELPLSSREAITRSDHSSMSDTEILTFLPVERSIKLEGNLPAAN